MKRIGQKETRINIVYEYSIDGCSIFDVLFQIGNSPDIHVRTVTLNDLSSRSDECVEILKECDMVITNPPFSFNSTFL